jgi:hypothetical protein
MTDLFGIATLLAVLLVFCSIMNQFLICLAGYLLEKHKTGKTIKDQQKEKH